VPIPVADHEERRYPIGQFHAPGLSTAPLRAAQIDNLRQFPERLLKAVRGLNEAQLDTPYREDGWTLRQVVHHLADSHANSYIRFKLALTEDWPTIKPYDEAAWARLPDQTLPIDVSLNLIAALHVHWVALLEALSEENFERGFNHPEIGRQTLASSLALHDWHARHHTAHITTLRQRRGW
jgi:uncharacterized damage-inducible protein DinB